MIDFRCDPSNLQAFPHSYPALRRVAPLSAELCGEGSGGLRMNANEMIGKTFGRWVVLRVEPPAGRRTRHRKIMCRCLCGSEKLVDASSVSRGASKSCGCLSRENPNHLVHGEYRSGEHRIWRGIKTRCYNSKSKSYKNYGGRGIVMADEWLNDFGAFLKHVGRRPSPNHSIDRIDNSGNYAPGNVRWATWVQQAGNRRPAKAD